MFEPARLLRVGAAPLRRSLHEPLCPGHPPRFGDAIPLPLVHSTWINELRANRVRSPSGMERDDSFIEVADPFSRTPETDVPSNACPKHRLLLLSRESPTAKPLKWSPCQPAHYQPPCAGATDGRRAFLSAVALDDDTRSGLVSGPELSTEEPLEPRVVRSELGEKCAKRACARQNNDVGVAI